MKNLPKKIDRKILKTLEPLNRLNPILIDELAAKSILDEVPAGQIICRHGEKDSRQIYLLSGQIETTAPGEKKTKTIKSKAALKTPIAEGSPRTITLKAKIDSTLLYIDADLLELLMSDEPKLTPTYEVSEISADDSDDWMLTFLQTPAFIKLPSENIQKLLTHMEEIPVKKDQVVINQGGRDDNYYIIKSGSCNVHRKPCQNSANVLLAKLPSGSGFGEEALISNAARNATITMCENGSLMRLKKDDFLTLLINPLISYYQYSETKKKLDEGSLIIDVRSEKEAKENPVADSVNIPLSMLRMKFDSLNAEREYLLVCNDGSQSAAAAFLMIQAGLLSSSVLKGGLNSNANDKKSEKPVAASKTQQNSISAKAHEQIILAKKQTEQLAAQQKQIKAAREKAEQDIIARKKELAESRARIEKKNQQLSNAEKEATLLKSKTAQELAKAQAETKAIELRQKETTDNILRAEKMMKQSQVAAEETRIRAEKDAELIKQRAIEEAEHLRAEVETARKKMEQDAAQIKEEEELIKKSALKVKQEADEIRRQALNDAQQIRSEIEQTRALSAQKLQQTEEEEKRKHAAILAKAKEQADKLSATKTQQAAAEAQAIRKKAKEDAQRLHTELEQTRKQIETEAARAIAELKQQSEKVVIAEEIKIIKEEVIVELVAEEDVDYKSVDIPGIASIEPINKIDDNEAHRKAEAIKSKLAQLQEYKIAQQSQDNIKVQKSNEQTILEDDDELFIFEEPEIAAKTLARNTQPDVSSRTKAESNLTQISIEPIQSKKSVVIYPQQEQETAYRRNNVFLNQEEAHTATSYNIPKFDKEAYQKNKHNSKTNTLAIAASFLMILAGSVFTLHATDTLKVQSIAALFNSGNDAVPTMAIAKTKTIRKKVLRADTKVGIKKKVGNKVDNIMQGWKNVLSEAQNPKKSLNNQ